MSKYDVLDFSNVFYYDITSPSCLRWKIKPANHVQVGDIAGIPFEIRDVKVINHGGGDYGDRHPYTPTIDKIDPNKGYTKDNCRIVIWWYNLSKSIWNDELVIETIHSWFKNKDLNGEFH